MHQSSNAKISSCPGMQMLGTGQQVPLYQPQQRNFLIGQLQLQILIFETYTKILLSWKKHIHSYVNFWTEQWQAGAAKLSLWGAHCSFKTSQI